MNSGVLKIAVAGLLALGLGAAGCTDRGATNLYSNPLFGVSQAGADFVVQRVERYEALSPTAGTGAYVVVLRNAGKGAAAGPIRGVFSTSLSPCATVLTFGDPQATAQFAFSGDVIGPGGLVQGYAVDGNGTFQSRHFALYANYDLSSCAGVSVPYTLALSDNFGGRWNAHFTAVAQ
jgi:hypothetical protein